MLGMEAVVAVEAPLLIVVLCPHQGVAALPADETLVVPALLSVRDEILYVYWQLATGAILRYRVLLEFLAPIMWSGWCLNTPGSWSLNLHVAGNTFLALQASLSQEKLSLLVLQQKPAPQTLETLGVEPLLLGSQNLLS